VDGVADYTFERVLSQGNQGSFYLARAPARLAIDADYVAVKVWEGPTGEALLAATRELRAFAAVPSPYLVRLFDAGQQGRTFFYAMEYLLSGSLGGPARPLNRPEILRAVKHAALGAHDLHEAGLVHRDIKPETILLDQEGAKLCDLGLAHIISPGRTLSHVGPIDSIEYLDPAILRGQRPGRWTDVWALGVTLHRALTGSGVYADLPSGDPLLAIRRVLNTAPQLDPSLAPAEGALISRCLTADRQARPPTAKAVAEAIEELSSYAPAR
jgi:eukaryotic-like serine/threonine-protein kinase